MKPIHPSKAKLFIGVIYKNKEIYNKVLKELTKKFGEIEKESFEYNFDEFTSYYKKEIGSNLTKKFIVFKKLIKRDKITDIKLFTNSIEEKYSRKGKRLINLDPGYLTEFNLILPSAKERPHKIYLKKGIFADLNYVFKKNSCIVFTHTFPDFKSEKVQKFFIEVRKDYLRTK
jgi:hypothetical protein